MDRLENVRVALLLTLLAAVAAAAAVAALLLAVAATRCTALAAVAGDVALLTTLVFVDVRKATDDMKDLTYSIHVQPIFAGHRRNQKGNPGKRGLPDRSWLIHQYSVNANTVGIVATYE